MSNYILLSLLSLCILLVGVNGATSISRITADISISDSAKGLESDIVHKSEYPASLNTKLSADSSKHLHVKISLPGTKLVPAQVFLQLVKDGYSTVFVAKHVDNLYYAKVNFGSSEFIDSVVGSGEYKMNVLIGDSALTKSLSWSVGTLNVNNIPDGATVKRITVDPYGVKEEIRHTFRQADSRPSSFIAFIFTIATALPLVGLVLTILAKFPSLSLPTSGSEFLYAVLFQLSLNSILALYILYWLRLNIFQALAGGFVLGITAIFTGNGALRLLHKRRAQKDKTA